MIVIAVILVIVLAGIIFEKDVIFQEGNPARMFVAISKLHFSGEKIVQISSIPDKYIVRNNDGYQPFIELKEKQGWKYVEQIGAGLIFEKNGIKHTCVSRMFTKYYRVIRE